MLTLIMSQSIALSYYLSEGLKRLLYLVPQFDASLLSLLQEMEKGNCQDVEENKFKAYQKRLSNDYHDILHCLHSLGLICAHLVFFLSHTTTPHIIFCDELIYIYIYIYIYILFYFKSCLHVKGAEICLEKISETETYNECSMVCKEFLSDVLSTLGLFLQQGTVLEALFALRLRNH